jgi:hypothetical protein
VRLAAIAAVVIALLVSNAAGASPDPHCTGAYGIRPARGGAPVRFGIDAGLAGSIGSAQMPSVPDDQARDLAAVKALRPPGRQLVVRLNRLFWSDGGAGIARFRRLATAYARAGLEVELQVRYHPAAGEVGHLAAWRAYVRHVVDSFGADPRVVAMTITNEVNVRFSPNTSDGYYPGAQDALIEGVEAAHAEAVHRGFRQLQFGFTYAYRFVPSQDAAFFSYLGVHGGEAFARALGFVGLDFYPGTVYPRVMRPGDTYRAELAQAAGVVRTCLAPEARISKSVALWITENGVPTGVLSDAAQARALAQLVSATSDYAGTFNITDYRWFNLRDASTTASTSGATFSSDGLVRADYTRKSAFVVYRRLIASLGARTALVPERPAPRAGLGATTP